MKSVFVFALIAIVVVAAHPHADVAEELKTKLGEVTKECAAKTNFSEENIKKLHAHDLTETENVRCFQKCFFEESGIVANDKFNNDRILEIVKVFGKDEAKTKTNFEKCNPLYKADAFDCDAAWEIFKCFH